MGIIFEKYNGQILRQVSDFNIVYTFLPKY